jgi:hypothetical protein
MNVGKAFSVSEAGENKKTKILNFALRPANIINK